VGYRMIRHADNLLLRCFRNIFNVGAPGTC